jgi:hypothetical protein
MSGGRRGREVLRDKRRQMRPPGPCFKPDCGRNAIAIATVGDARRSHSTYGFGMKAAKANLLLYCVSIADHERRFIPDAQQRRPDRRRAGAGDDAR